MEIAILPYDLPAEYAWVYDKNNALATTLAEIVDGQVVDYSEASQPNMAIPMFALERDEAVAYGVDRFGQLYGAVVDDVHHSEKGILHQLIRPNAVAPSWYREDLAAAASDAIMPGYTAFGVEDASIATEALQSLFGNRVRLKHASAMDGQGQHVVDNIDMVRRELSTTPGLFTDGVVIEPHLSELSRKTVTEVHFAGRDFAWAGEQFVENTPQGTRYRGIRFTCVRGILRNLIRATDDPTLRLAIEQGNKVHEAYATIGAIVSKGTYDVLQGITGNGTWLSGVTDPSLRPAGSSPAEVRAIRNLFHAPLGTTVEAEAWYHYGQYDPGKIKGQIFSRHAGITIETGVSKLQRPIRTR